uniref:Putative secreted protein n=1 Tax=Anopheles marajoara TaxID=58244 RepID=A0A2M4CFE0_9DIPT
MMCGFSRVTGIGMLSSLMSGVSGASVPLVSTMLRTPRLASCLMPKPGLKHQKCTILAPLLLGVRAAG